MPLKITNAELNARLTTVEREIGEFKKDLKAIGATCSRIELAVAGGPKNESVSAIETRLRILEVASGGVAELDGRVKALEADDNKARGGLRVLVAISGIIGAIIGWLFSWLKH